MDITGASEKSSGFPNVQARNTGGRAMARGWFKLLHTGLPKTTVGRTGLFLKRRVVASGAKPSRPRNNYAAPTIKSPFYKFIYAARTYTFLLGAPSGVFAVGFRVPRRFQALSRFRISIVSPKMSRPLISASRINVFGPTDRLIERSVHRITANRVRGLVYRRYRKYPKRSVTSTFRIKYVRGRLSVPAEPSITILVQRLSSGKHWRTYPVRWKRETLNEKDRTRVRFVITVGFGFERPIKWCRWNICFHFGRRRNKYTYTRRTLVVRPLRAPR